MLGAGYDEQPVHRTAIRAEDEIAVVDCLVQFRFLFLLILPYPICRQGKRLVKVFQHVGR